MNSFNRTIIALNENVEDVAIRLGECQHYSDKISDKMLFSIGTKNETDSLNLFQLIKILKKRKDKIVSFYCVKEKNRFHIYSDFFNLDDAFLDSYSFFDDLDRVLLMSEKCESEIIVDLIKHGKKVCHLTVNINDEKRLDHALWQHSYAKIYNTIDGLPSVSDIADSLDFILRNSSKTDNQMKKFLELNSLFKDEYVI